MRLLYPSTVNVSARLPMLFWRKQQKNLLRLRKLREKSGFTVEQIAFGIEVPIRTIYEWEAGKPTIRLDVLPHLAAAYGLKRVKDLFPDQ